MQNTDKSTQRIKATGQLNKPLCPRCKSSHTHRSQRRTLMDRVMALMGRRVFSCSDCRHRIYRKVK